MTAQDLFITPIYIILFSLIAYYIRPYVTVPQTRKFFMLALIAKFTGAFALGLIYQFYYNGGDTYNYFTHGSRWIWEAFLREPSLGIKLLLESGGISHEETFEFSQNIWYFRDPKSFFVVKLVAFADLFTFHTYSASAMFFALFSFSGSWALYSAVQKKYPGRAKMLAISILFIPSVVLWGSGILKDSITLGALCWLTWGMIHIIDFGKRNLGYFVIALGAIWLIFSIKTYIVICYVPLLIVWIYWKQLSTIRNQSLKILIAPILLVVFGLVGYIAMSRISSYSEKYSLDAIATQAAITAYDIRYGWGARIGGDGGYDLGTLDGSWQSMIRLMPNAINVSLFRPYLWEVRNPLMMFAALEALLLLLFSLRAFVFQKAIQKIFKDPFLVFCFTFSLMFAFAVGVSTFNFGTLMRYKIPMMPFYTLVLLVNTKTSAGKS